MRFPELIAKVASGKGRRLDVVLGAGIRPDLPDGRYLHWDRLRHRTPPANLSPEEWWLGAKLARNAISKDLPFQDVRGRAFRFSVPDSVLERLHRIDRDAAGQIQTHAEVVSSEGRERYVLSSLVEEAITSSQLEGAATTRQVAKDMIRDGRKPRDRDERMIFNNYAAMSRIREIKDRPLSLELIFELHRVLTAETLDEPDAAGRFRAAHEDIHVFDEISHRKLHTPPPAEQLPERLRTLCDFANTEPKQGEFVHPVLRAILLHLMLAYDHPFVDGNGRTARALFYWAMARQGYWLMEYVSISSILRKKPAQYGLSFLYTETDDNDATYFIDHQLRVICEAIDNVLAWLERKQAEMQDADALLCASGPLADHLNHRQRALLVHAFKHPGYIYGIQGHRRSHGVTYETARTDLLELDRLGFMNKRKRGRAWVFQASRDLMDRIERSVKRR